jgi:serine/threonine-protein kinase
VEIDELLERIRGGDLGDAARDALLVALTASGETTVTAVAEIDWLEGSAPALGGSATMDLDALDGPPPPGAPSDLGLPDRYEAVGRLGEGGMGEVLLVRDRALERTVALKLVRGSLATQPRTLARFREEAQVAAQLEHPSIVPVYDIGRLDDGRWFFTMKEVRGRTFRELLREEPEVRRCVEVLRRVCDAVGYAHFRGVLHRDLKPSNVMIGDFGEVLVMDWGLVKVMGDSPSESGESVTSDRQGSALETQMGAVAGTPRYMAPEQARGEANLGPPADVYAIGAMLYEVLTGQVPHQSATVGELLARRRKAETVQTPSTLMSSSAELEAVALRALAPHPGDRYPTARALGIALQEWLDGARRRARGLALVETARERGPQRNQLERDAQKLEIRAREALDSQARTSPETTRWKAWAWADEAEALRQEAVLNEARAERELHAALSHSRDLPEAHAALAHRYMTRHREAEEAGQVVEARRLEEALRAHDRGEHRAYLEGHGAVSLVTEPAGAEVELFGFEERNRRLVPISLGMLGRTPLQAVELPMGSYLLMIRARGREPVTYPVHIARQHHWDGVRPGERAPTVIDLPAAGSLSADEVLLPAGWFLGGGSAPGITPGKQAPRGRYWCDGLVVKRNPVTNAEYVQFLNVLVAAGRRDEALQHAPRPQNGEPGTSYYRMEPDGRFALGTDAQGHAWLPDMPVVAISFPDAVAYANHLTGGWRLLCGLEWEKAMRGVDGRIYPFGRFLDPTWCCMRDSWEGADAGPVSVERYPLDRSVYGVRHGAGNAKCWVLDADDGRPRATEEGVVVLPAPSDTGRQFLRGGSWYASTTHCRTDWLSVGSIDRRDEACGFRLVRPLGTM